VEDGPEDVLLYGKYLKDTLYDPVIVGTLPQAREVIERVGRMPSSSGHPASRYGLLSFIQPGAEEQPGHAGPAHSGREHGR